MVIFDSYTILHIYDIIYIYILNHQRLDGSVDHLSQQKLNFFSDQQITKVGNALDKPGWGGTKDKYSQISLIYNMYIYTYITYIILICICNYIYIYINNNL